MKTLILTLATTVSFNTLASDSINEFFKDIQLETKKCAVKFVKHTRAESEIVGFRSNCSTLKIISNTQATIRIDKETYTAIISESEQSDGGDLDDLTIKNYHGKVVAVKKNIPAFDSVILAMAGDSDIREE